MKKIYKKMIERTLVLIKPDGVKRSLSGEIISRFEKTGLKIIGLKMVHIDKEFAKKHYPESIVPRIGENTMRDYTDMGMTTKDSKEAVGKKAWETLLNFITEGPIIAMVLEGVHAIEVVRKITGVTSPNKAQPGTIRGDFAILESYALADVKKRVLRNLIHASDTPENAKREIGLWFDNKEIHKYTKELDKHF